VNTTQETRGKGGWGWRGIIESPLEFLPETLNPENSPIFPAPKDKPDTYNEETREYLQIIGEWLRETRNPENAIVRYSRTFLEVINQPPTHQNIQRAQEEMIKAYHDPRRRPLTRTISLLLRHGVKGDDLVERAQRLQSGFHALRDYLLHEDPHRIILERRRTPEEDGTLIKGVLITQNPPSVYYEETQAKGDQPITTRTRVIRAAPTKIRETHPIENKGHGGFQITLKPPRNPGEEETLIRIKGNTIKGIITTLNKIGLIKKPDQATEALKAIIKEKKEMGVTG